MTSNLKLWEESLNSTLTTLAAEGERNRNSLNSYSRVVDACLGTLTKDIEELKGRIQNLEEADKHPTMSYEGDTMTHEADEPAIVDALRWALPLAREALANSSVLFSHGASVTDWAQYERAKAALEGQGSRDLKSGSSVADQVVPPVSPAHPAPLVEKLCLIFHKQQSPTYPDRCEMAKEALLVAAEELLDEITLDEWEDACTRYGSNAPGATTNGVLRSRLARAKEAAR